MNKIRIPADSLLWLNKKLERKKMEDKVLKTILVLASVIVFLMFTFLGHTLYTRAKNQGPCNQICAPSVGRVYFDEILGSEVSCICDLTKERVEVP